MPNRKNFLRDFPEALADDAGAFFVGAGVSVGAGYPSWKGLLKDIGDELGVSSDDVADLAALAQWAIRRRGNETQIRNVIKDQIGTEHPIPETLRTIARLPTRHIWTTNYDRLIERALTEIGRPIDMISSEAGLSLRPKPGAVRIYKMHGSVDRLDDIVISTDHYELFRAKRGAFLPLLQAHMTSFNTLFVGFSFTDPNLRHVLSMIRERFTDSPPTNYAIVRPPHRADFNSLEEYEARLSQHKFWADDLQRYGLHAVEVEEYGEIPQLLEEVERRLARRRIWISGSWPIESQEKPGVSFIHEVARRVGIVIGQTDMTLVSGSGILVGSSAISGFLKALQERGAWDLERRLIVRPFPQPVAGEKEAQEQWPALRDELARIAGTVVFIGGRKLTGGHSEESTGMHEERRAADARGAFLLPIGATGGAAGSIAQSLIGSAVESSGPNARRPTDMELLELLDGGLGAEQIAVIVGRILKRIRN